MASIKGTPSTGNRWMSSLLWESQWSGQGATTVLDVYVAGGSGREVVEHWDGAVTATRPGGAEAAAIRAAMAAVEAVCNIDFRTVASQGDADIVWASVSNADAGGDLGWAYLPGTNAAHPGGPSQSLIVINNEAYDPAGGPGALVKGGYDFCTVIHELGHALGLDHPHDDGGDSAVMPGVGAAFDDLGDFNANQGAFTMMGYNDGWVTGPQGPSPSLVWGHQKGPMALDVAALQLMYGANRSTGRGDDSYGLPGANQAGTGYACIWDAGGRDTIAGADRGNVIDLRAATLEAGSGLGGHVSHATGVHGGFTIARGVVIENARGGAGVDVIKGNEAANDLSGARGDDRLWGGGGHDRLSGGQGDDVLHAGGGDDRLTGGAGKDKLHGDGGHDDFVFAAAADSEAGSGRDVVADFVRGQDDIHLAAIDAKVGLAGNQAFSLDAGGTFARGEIRQKLVGDDLRIELNLDTDGAAEMSILLLDVSRPLGAGDFIL